MACEHDKITVTVDAGDGETEEVCPICDDVDVRTLDERQSVEESDDPDTVDLETLDDE